MSNIAELSVQINADTGNFSSGMTSAADSVQSFGAQTISVTRSVSKSFLNMTKIVSGFSVGASAALVAVVTSQSAIALANVRMADSWGIPIKSMYEFQAAAKSVGVDADEMANILKDVGEKLGEYFMTGGGGAADAFEQLNLQVKDFIDLDASEAFLKIGESMQHLDIKEQIFLIESLASESSKLLPIFENNAEGYKKAIEEATASGNILTANQATAAAEFAKSTTKIGSMISGLSKQLTVQLSRPFALMIEWINKVIKEAGGVEQVAKNIAKSFINGIASIIKSGGELLSYFDNVELKMLKIELAWAKTKKAMSFSWLDSNEVIMSVNADVTDAENKIEALKKDIEKRVDISVSADNMADDLIGKLGTSGMPEPEQFSTSGNRGTTNSAAAAQAEYIAQTQASIDAYKQTTTAMNGLSDATQNVASKSNSAADSYSATASSLGSLSSATQNVTTQANSAAGAYSATAVSIGGTKTAYNDAANSVSRLAGAADSASSSLNRSSSESSGEASTNKWQPYSQMNAIEAIRNAAESQGGFIASSPTLKTPDFNDDRDRGNSYDNVIALRSETNNKAIDYRNQTSDFNPNLISNLPAQTQPKSMQDYINESPSGTNLQQLRLDNMRNQSPMTNTGTAQIGWGDALNDVQKSAESFNGSSLSSGSTQKITLNLVTDMGKIEGDLIGSQSFIDKISELAARQVNQSARMAAQ